MDQSLIRPSGPLTYKVHTFGCKVNTYDTGLIQRNLNQSGLALSPMESEPRIHVLNTCAVTAEATKEAVKYIRRLKSKDPFCTVVITGCGAQVDTGFFSNLPGADLVIANSHKSQMPFIIEQYFKGEIKDKVFKSNIFKKEDLESGGGVEKEHTRSFLKIQDGCNSFCTYCIIPYARGKSRSLKVSDLIRRVQELSNQGVREIVLTGVHIGDYEDSEGGKNRTLEDLVEALLKNTKNVRFRLSSLEPVEISDRLLSLYSDQRMCPHFHMSIQSANTEVLHLMKRKYTQANVREALLKIQKQVPGAFVGMDVITGFCNETHEHFEDTYLTLAELPWTKIHVFPYSERPGTRAAQFVETVPQRDRSLRSQRLRELSLSRYESEALKQNGKQKEVLVLKQKDSTKLSVLSEDYWSIEVSLEMPTKLKAGDMTRCLVTGYDSASTKRMEGHLRGELL